MSKWTIYGKDGKAKHESITKYNGDGKVVYQDTLEYSGKWMGECFLTVSIKSAYPIDFQIGDYIVYRRERFTINYDPTVIKKAARGTYGEGFTYDSIKFNSPGNELTEIQFHDWVLSDNKYHYTSLPNFSFYCKDVDDLADRLQANTNRWCHANGFKPGEYWMFYTLKNNTDGTADSGQTQTHYHRTVQRAVNVLESCGITDTSSTEYTGYLSAIQTQWESVYGKDEDYKDSRDDESYDRTITASGQTVWDMMSAIKQQFGLNFIIRGRNVYIGTAGVPTDHIFMYGKGNGLYEVDKTADQDQKVVTKLHAYGSDENLPTRYYADLNTLPYATITEIVDNASFNYCRFLTDLTYAPRYFTNPLSQYGDNIYAVTIKIDDITVNARVEHLSSDTYVRIYSEYVTTNPDPDDNTDLDNFKKFQAALAAGKQITFTGGVKKDAFPSSHLTAADQNLPDNMAVNYLMLPGFPTKPLADICRAEYDSTEDVTNYYITNPSVENATEVLFHTESGNHVVKFSSDKYDPYILSPNADSLGVKEGDIFCNEENDDNGLKKVYPTIEEVTDKDAGTGSTGARLDAVVKADTIEDNGVWPQNKTTEISGFHIWIPALGFRLDEAASAAGGDEFKISMKNGYCGGRTFDVTDCSQETDGTWKLTCKRSPDNDLDLYFPYSYAASVSSVKEGMTDAYQILAGDNYVLTGIEISELNYVWAAAVKLLRKAIHWLCKNDYTRYVYTPKIDEIYMAKQDREAKAAGTDSLHDTLKEGDILLFEDEDLGLNGAVYIDQLNIKENGNNGIPTYDVTLRNEIQVGTLERIQNTVDSIRTDIANGNVGGGGLSTTDVDVLVKQYGLKYFLSKLNADTAAGLITFLQGIALGEDGKYYVNEKGQAALASVISDKWGITAGGAATLLSVIAEKWGITAEGLATFAKTVTGVLRTTGYTDATMQGSGASIYEQDGRAYTVTDFLTVRIKAIFAALEVRKLMYVGGNYAFTHAGSTLISQEELQGLTDADGNALQPVNAITDSSGNITAWRCRFKDDDGTTRTMNMWVTGDMALCQTFDIKSPGTYGNVSNRYYWRLVTCTGTETVTYTKQDGTTEQRQIGYVELSNLDMFYGALTDSDGTKVYAEGYDGSNGQTSVWIGRDPLTRGSSSDSQQEQYRTAAATMLKYKELTDGFSNDTPQAGDTIVQAGCQRQGMVKERGGVVEIVTEGVGGEPVPAVNIYASINDYRWSKFKVIQLSPDGIIGVAKYFSLRTDSTAGDPVPVLNYRGAYSDSVEFSYYDSVTYDGLMWLYAGKEPSTGSEPSLFSEVWQLISGGGEMEIVFYGSTGIVSRKGCELTLEAHLVASGHDFTRDMLANGDIKMTWTRDTGVESFDKAWTPTTGDTANILLISHHNPAGSGQRRDLGEDWETKLSCTFTFTATLYDGQGNAKKNIPGSISVTNQNI